MTWFVVLLVGVSSRSVTASCKLESGQHCIFPFRHKNITYAGCTEDHDPDGRLWCSTEVDDEGNHLAGKKAWIHCPISCPKASNRINPDCKSLVVKDKDEDFSSGIYIVDKKRTSHGWAVYVNPEKQLFMFRLDKNLGWAIGYEKGITSGGSFYSSGPEVTDEPWLGQWNEESITVECSERIPFLSSITSVSDTSRKCEGNEACLTREHCPAIERAYAMLLGKRKNDQNSKAIAEELKRKVCNKKQKGFCCQTQDQSMCNNGELCLPVDRCPYINSRVESLRSRTASTKELVQVYKELKGRLCDARNEMFCCG